MLLPAILLAALAAPTPDMTAQEPAADPPPQEEVKSAPLSTGSTDAAIQAGLKAFRRRNFRQAEIQFRTAMDADPSSPGVAGEIIELLRNEIFNGLAPLNSDLFQLVVAVRDAEGRLQYDEDGRLLTRVAQSADDIEKSLLDQINQARGTTK